jgi:hypothetical protein
VAKLIQYELLISANNRYRIIVDEGEHMKEKRTDYKQGLINSEARLRELESKGIGALSRYDIEIASMGNAEEALRTAKYLVSNHIMYYRKLLGEYHEQLSLF